MGHASRIRTIAAALAIGIGGGITASPASAQDAAPGLWQDYRYPASNPYWRVAYYDTVGNWGYNPTGLRPSYYSSPDAVWTGGNPQKGGDAVGGGWTGGWNGSGPYFTAPQWYAYQPREFGWSGLEYNIPATPPESTTGYKARYGPSSPGAPSRTPESWREWERNTPMGQEYTARLNGSTRAEELRPGSQQLLARLEKRSLKQYSRLKEPAAGKKNWQEKEAPVPAEPGEIPPKATPERTGFTEYYLKITGPGRGRWVTREELGLAAEAAPAPGPRRVPPPALKDVEPPAAKEAQPPAAAAPAEDRGFTVYYRKSQPGPQQGSWTSKSAKP